MNLLRKISSLAAACLVGAFGMAQAAEVLVTDNISASATWTASNTYNLQKQVYVLPGATLTIEAGTVIASDTGVGGSLAVCRGGKIYVNGTRQNPVIMTSKADVATWQPLASHPTGKNPKTGTWRTGVNEWGNLTIMGNGLVSENPSVITTNTLTPTGLNHAVMEGLTADVAAGITQSSITYGGNDDNDDSGSISYLSLRYGGKVVGLANELNGLSLGGVGRGTDIQYVDIMNNVDDGIEIWGGTVNLKYVNIWNIGDDTVDIDQGWRGKMQFGLLVQGYSALAAQGSGVGDNIFEMDGAERADAQPVTTGQIYNFTAIGQPIAGDQATAWRDNVRMQFRNCIFMNTGEQVVKNDDTDGEAGNGELGYGDNGTLSFVDTWATAASVRPTVNAITPTPAAGAFNNPDVLYPVQTDGKLAEIKDTVFYANNFASAYTTANSVNVFGLDNNNVIGTVSPIQSLTLGAPVSTAAGNVLPVTQINPSAFGAARTSVASAPNDGFYTPAAYRGGFSSDVAENWLTGWTSADAFGMISTTPNNSSSEVVVNTNISQSTVWTANNTYNIQGQVYVLPGATLTIEAGTVVACTTNAGGSLAVCRGARIFVQGTADEPVIMTSKADVATWDALASHPTGKNPKTGTWRVSANEWGNLTIMGRGLVSKSSLYTTSTLTPTGLNEATMEGLTADVAAGITQSTISYGGNDDNDDSGSISYLSLRYGGKVVGLANELNGLSLGGVGRATEIDHVEIMNNVDDGIEIWGGTVNLKYVNVWNIGDDSIDIDQGWRGKMQFGLIVQGYSANAAQGSGVGDNIFEIDGAERADAQPVTTGQIYNFTAIGQPISGDQATAWRDNARMQFRNCIFMDTGEQVVKNDDTDGETGNGEIGYGDNGTLSFVDTWATAATVRPTVNAITPTPAAGVFNNPDVLYPVQTDGKLAEITDSVVYNNNFATAYTTANSVNVFATANHNTSATLSPVAKVTRGTQVNPNGALFMLPVTKIDPTPKNDAVVSVAAAPADGFYTPAMYRGGFSPNSNNNWLKGWSATAAYGFLDLPGQSAVEHWTLY